MSSLRCRRCGRAFPEGEQFCSQDGTRLLSLLTEESDPSSADQAAAAEQVVAADPLVGSTLDGRYRILRVIGEGGMGVVYEALHVLLEKHVAIKVLRDTFTGRADVVERFRQEAKSASKIGHPNIVDVSDFGETPTGQSYIVMEMLIGEDLADVLARERALSSTRAVRIAYQVARALHATHKKSIVHRDLKPENIYLVERDGAHDVVKIVDFGVAKMNDVEVRPGRRLTRTGMLFGTPEYMSPEQALGRPFDHRVDIYALGAILFELLAGRVPFTGDNFMEILAHHGHSPLPSLRSINKHLQVSPELEAVIARALAKDPAARYTTMGEFADDLRNVPEMAGAGLDEVVSTGAWASVRLALDTATPSEPPQAPARALTPPPLPSPSRSEGERSGYGGAFSVRARAASEPERADQPALDIDLDDADVQEAVLLSAGADLKLATKLGFGLAVVSGLLGLFLLQRSPEALRSLPHVTGVGRGAESAESVANAAAAEPAATDTAPQQPGQPTPSVRVDAPGGLQTPVDTSGGPIPRDRDKLTDRELPARAGPNHAAASGAAHARTNTTPEPLTRRGALMTRGEPSLDAQVEVMVRTVPAGASVSVLGTNARCEPSPCAVLVPRDRAVTLRAEARNTSVQRTLTIAEPGEVELRVGSRPRPGGSSVNSSALTKAPRAPRAPSDLKVPSIFREH